METVVVYDSVRRWQTSFNKQVVAGINETGYYTGFFGLGITPGRFNDVVAQSPIAALVEQSGVIPSHSYGYTAGAYYGRSMNNAITTKTCPNSDRWRARDPVVSNSGWLRCQSLRTPRHQL